jgi:hypothetical protein
MRQSLINQQQGTVTRGREWSVAQIVQGVAGILLVVLGGAVFAKTGLHFNPPGHAHVLFTQTTWLAGIELVLGIMLLAGATTAWDRSIGIFASLATVAVGLILALVPDAASGRFAGNDSTPGVVLAIIGGICALVVMIAPSHLSSSRTAVVDRDRELL